ncbi:MAG: TetR/AcrR family transcriptional regulator [Prevotellaceae bacterium]|nr:TetR/AcrR family transcriptional regulator [Prevotellaceae bacterium]MDD5991557.1 TetR/AcrR family transcriptional regulator [Prevotellaceae bacterium]MDD6780558.1 TetR/AcrR family transcriptional regulator [Prevotellaceae bacterium]
MNRIRYNTSYRTSLKDKILDSAIALFHERGVKAVKMDDIANCLSISKRTLYEIYDNKEDLLFECVKTSFEHSEKELHESVENADNVMDILLRIYRLKMNLLRKTHPSFYCELEKYPKILEYFEKQDGKRRAQQMDFIKRGIREGYFRNDVNYDLILDLFDVSNRYIISNYNSLNYSMEQLSYNLVFVFLRGFCTLRGVEILDKFLDEDIYKPGFSPKEEK